MEAGGPARAGMAEEAGMAVAHSPIWWKRRPTTSQTASADASTMKCQLPAHGRRQPESPGPGSTGCATSS